jgi:hypothetical protein
MRCEYAREDGAYVLGALAPAERASYERHLAGCPQCREAVAVLAVLPGLLGRLDAETAEQVARDSSGTEPSRLPNLLRTAGEVRRRDSIRQRWRAAGSGLAAAGLALVVGLGLGLVRDTEAPPATVERIPMAAMVPVAVSAPPGPVIAELGLSAVTGGTKVRMHCTYNGGGQYHDPWAFRLYAFGSDGKSEQIGSWVAGPGDDLWVDGMTRYRMADLVRLELRLGNGTPLLVLSP